jgi:hypothetical protein
MLNKTDVKYKSELVDTTDYLSMLMSAMFVAKRVKHMCLTPLSILATRVRSPTATDMESLVHVYQYLYRTREYGIRFTPTSMLLQYWIDASYGTHPDSCGHGGILVILGEDNAPVLAVSKKQKLNSRSSCESELIELDIGLNHLLWFSILLEFLGYPQYPVSMYQDNKSTIHICENGDMAPNKLKHMASRTNFIYSKIKSDVIKLVYCPTLNMLADLLTKPLKGGHFKTLSNIVMNTPDHVEYI